MGSGDVDESESDGAAAPVASGVPAPLVDDDPAAVLAGDLRAAGESGRAGGRRWLIGNFDRHEWGVLLPLALVGFFINYDTGLLSLAAPPIAEGLGVTVATFGIAVAVVRLAALGSVGSLRLADRWGRRRMLFISVLAFTAATGLTAVAWGLIAFVAFQCVARLFLATEETLAGVVLSEELRPDRRGAGIGLLGIIGTTGFGLVALMLLFVEDTPLGWRLFYVVALLPLLVVTYLRRNLRETRAFGLASAEGRVQPRWIPRVPREYRRRLWTISVLMGLMGMLNTAAFFYAAELAQDTYDWGDLFTLVVVAAAPTTLAGYLIGGRLSDRFGRRPALAAGMLGFAAGSVVVFTERPALFAVGFFILAGADAAVQSVRAAYLSELFPTEIRATLAAFVSAVVVAGGSVGLVVVGVLAGTVDTSTVLIAIALTVAASTLAVRTLPETVGVDITHADQP